MSETLLASVANNILLQTLMTEVGIEVKVISPVPLTNPALRAKQVLYRFKKENPDFANIQIKFAPESPSDTLWLINLRE